jgi:hypothetical protein
MQAIVPEEGGSSEMLTLFIGTFLYAGDGTINIILLMRIHGTFRFFPEGNSKQNIHVSRCTKIYKNISQFNKLNFETKLTLRREHTLQV